MTDMYAPQTDPKQQESVEQENAMTQSEATEKQVTKTDTSEESTISDKESDIPQTSAEIITRIKALKGKNEIKN